MSHLMAHDKLEEQLPKLIPTMINLYKKNAEHYIISKVPFTPHLRLLGFRSLQLTLRFQIEV